MEKERELEIKRRLQAEMPGTEMVTLKETGKDVACNYIDPSWYVTDEWGALDRFDEMDERTNEIFGREEVPLAELVEALKGAGYTIPGWLDLTELD